eukprot:CAMPEP_0197857482 /NCGR_PEP_ID=MMETSP1438-20131217/30607_1 /TAXON_ID=1461541 /ORGANISM="Pterosperma sp., Strain CCMP1384" /LENGTH=208 /DNA_ID=CAMNT_0043473333 /DNA_START=302 /DNA_END=924 /DNA_ORIENTATION=+
MKTASTPLRCGSGYQSNLLTRSPSSKLRLLAAPLGQRSKSSYRQQVACSSQGFPPRHQVTSAKRDPSVKAQAATPPSSTSAASDSVIADENKYLLQNYGPRTPVVFSHGEGCFLYDVEGKAYLDFAAGIAVNVLGHSNAAWAAAVKEQADKLCHVSNLYHTVPHVKLAQQLVENSFADRVFFCNSGTEANEAAIKFARRHAGAHAEEG